MFGDFARYAKKRFPQNSPGTVNPGTGQRIPRFIVNKLKNLSYISANAEDNLLKKQTRRFFESL
jgi:hypothetical protein